MVSSVDGGSNRAGSNELCRLCLRHRMRGCLLHDRHVRERRRRDRYGIRGLQVRRAMKHRSVYRENDQDAEDAVIVLVTMLAAFGSFAFYVLS